MLSILLEFDVIPGKESEFKEAWIETTNYIFNNFGSLGSRLHRAEDGKFLAYAQWPDLETYEMNHKWSKEGLESRNRMRNTLVTKKPKILQKLTIESDLLKSEQYS